MTLESLISALLEGKNKDIYISLYDKNKLLLIYFGIAGYDCLDDYLLKDKVTSITINSNTSLEICIDTTENAAAGEDTLSESEYDEDGNMIV